MKRENIILSGIVLLTLIILPVLLWQIHISEQKREQERIVCERNKKVWIYFPVNVTLTPYTEGYATDSKIHGSITTITTFVDGTFEFARADWSVQYGDSYYAATFPPTNDWIHINHYTLLGFKEPLSIASIEFIIASGSFNDTLTFNTKSDLPPLPHPYVDGEPLTLALTKNGQHFRTVLTVVGQVAC